MIDKVLLSMLACPACRGDVGEKDEMIICASCGRQYPVRNGIPIMLVDEAVISLTKE